mmetsp:Transcript_19624/g.68075  ORF Transcript_19624/g.68075 Transcript_19624/m.68075 type:complete len:741 (-) Transcript_19624:28-2250(-)
MVKTEASQPARRTVPTNQEIIEIDDDVAILGVENECKLPHARGDCPKHKFQVGSLSVCAGHCAQCYCYVCDAPAAKCGSWDRHCEATAGDPYWRKQREAARTGAAPPAAAGAVVPNPATHTLDALLAALAVVHPVEAPQPAAVVTPLRHYQKQALARMVEVETSPTAPRGDHGVAGGFLAQEVGMGKTCAVLALVAANPSAAAAPTADQIQTIRTNRSKLAQLKEPEFDFDLFSKMGDKYRKQHGDARKAYDAQVKALLPWHSADFYAAGDSKAPQRPKLKTTVVFTSVSLLGQWEDECARHAPGLVVRRFHPTSKGKTAKFLDESQTTANPPDVIISTTTFSWPDWTKDYEFHRVVVDESHLFGTASAKRNYADAVPSLRRWCCTATPMSMSAGSISTQALFLGRQDLLMAAHYFDLKRPGSFAAFKDKLAPIFIRHTKAQRIGGSCALALPASVARTVTLTMSADERALYDFELQTASASKRTSLLRLSRHGGKRYELERCLGNFLVSAANSYSDAHPAPTLPPFQRMHVATKRPGRLDAWNLRPEKSSKLVALRADLANLRRRDASCHAVVFTAYNRLHKAACAALRDDGFVVCEFTGGTSANDRDKHIRTFQSGLGKRGAPATVFVITTRSGNVGITLTAATRVYLMEPMLDPGTEVQAAGRIHRLGQTKDVLVTRFCFKNTVEEDIVKLHAKIAAGDIALSDSHFPAAGVKILMPPFEEKRKASSTSSSKGCAQS